MIDDPSRNRSRQCAAPRRDAFGLRRKALATCVLAVAWQTLTAPIAQAADEAEPLPKIELPAPPPGAIRPRTRSIGVPENLATEPAPPVTPSVPPPAPQKLGDPRLSPRDDLRTNTEGYVVASLNHDNRVLVLEVPDMRAQGLMFGRIVLFVETALAPKTEVIRRDNLANWLNTQKMRQESITAGNNLRAAELARFFNSVVLQKDSLSAEEALLRDWLIAWNVLSPNGQAVKVVQPEQILITTPAVSTVSGCPACTISAATRDAIFEHELAHARYFCDSAYRDYALWFWSHGMDYAIRERFTGFLRLRGYDISIKELLANEMQAFLMHTKEPDLFSAVALGIGRDGLLSLRTRYADGLATLRLSDWPLKSMLALTYENSIKNQQLTVLQAPF